MAGKGGGKDKQRLQSTVSRTSRSRSRSRSPIDHRVSRSGSNRVVLQPTEATDRVSPPLSSTASNSAQVPNASLSIADMQRVVADAIALQMPLLISEASRAATERVESHKANDVSKELKELKKKHEDLALVGKAATFKSEGVFFFFLDLWAFFGVIDIKIV